MLFRGTTLLLVLLACALALPAGANDPAADRSKTRQKGGTTSKAATSMTGCIDERDGGYVLVNDRDMTPVARLVADGFPTEGFAKHLGRKVTVRGQQASTDGRSVFKVRAVTVVSETCAPSASPQ